MPKISKTNDGRLLFYCQGCKMMHGVTDSWSFNGDFEKPTFSPSVLVRATRLTEKGESDYEEWCKAGFPKEEAKVLDHVKTVCHSFVTDGKIQYLNDCTHELAGQTVDLVDEDDWFEV